MPDPKLIFRERFQVAEVDKTKLSYEDLFQVKSNDEVDYQEVIERNNIEWTKRMNDTRQLAVKEGYDAGLNDGETKARIRIDEQLHHFENALMELDRRLQQTIEEIKPGITSLVFDLAEKVIGVPVDNEGLKNWVVESVSTALEEIGDHTKVEIEVSEADYDSIKEVIEKLPELKKIKLNYSASILAGEFRIETPHNVIMNNFAKKLADLRLAAPLADWGLSKS